jgi:hypothetical protein
VQRSIAADVAPALRGSLHPRVIVEEEWAHLRYIRRDLALMERVGVPRFPAPPTVRHLAFVTPRLLRAGPAVDVFDS